MQKQNIDSSVMSFKEIILSVGAVRPKIKDAGQNVRYLNKEKNTLVDRMKIADEISDSIKESADQYSQSIGGKHGYASRTFCFSY